MFFQHVSPCHRHFASRLILFQMCHLNENFSHKFSTPKTFPLPTQKSSSTHLRPAVILHPCRQPNSSLPTQRPSSTPVSGQTHPSLPRGHPSPLLAVRHTPLLPAVILHLCSRPTLPLPTRQYAGDWRQELGDGSREMGDRRGEMW